MATVAQYAPHTSVRSRRRPAARLPRSRVIAAWVLPATLTLRREGNVVTAIATSMLAGTIHFHWYVDGAYVASTTTNQWSFALEDGERVRIAVIDTNDAAFDPVAGAPEGFPARRTLRWVRSLNTTIDRHQIEQRKNGGAWTVIGRVAQDARRWSYALRTPVLEDLADYKWKVTAIHTDGNVAYWIIIDMDDAAGSAERVVRTPDAPQFTIDYDSGTQKVTFTEAA